jgi:hypothetical protein
MTTPERQSYIDKIRALPAELEALVAHLTDEELERREAANEWSVRQIVHHIADAHMNCNSRLRLPLTEDNPPLKTYDQDAWALQLDYKLPVQPSLAIIRGVHERWVVLLSSLSDEQWTRPCHHTEWGNITVESVAQEYSGHGYVHIDQIKRALGNK